MFFHNSDTPLAVTRLRFGIKIIKNYIAGSMDRCLVKRLVINASRPGRPANFVTSGVRWKPTVLIKKHKWLSKDARGPADHFRGRMDSIGQDLGGVKAGLKF